MRWSNETAKEVQRELRAGGQYRMSEPLQIGR
jgi:hypothetical protein